MQIWLPRAMTRQFLPFLGTLDLYGESNQRPLVSFIRFSFLVIFFLPYGPLNQCSLLSLKPFFCAKRRQSEVGTTVSSLLRPSDYCWLLQHAGFLLSFLSSCSTCLVPCRNSLRIPSFHSFCAILNIHKFGKRVKREDGFEERGTFHVHFQTWKARCCVHLPHIEIMNPDWRLALHIFRTLSASSLETMPPLVDSRSNKDPAKSVLPESPALMSDYLQYLIEFLSLHHPSGGVSDHPSCLQ